MNTVKIVNLGNSKSKSPSTTPHFNTGDLVEYRGMPAVVSCSEEGAYKSRIILINSEGYPAAPISVKNNKISKLKQDNWSLEYGRNLLSWYYDTYCGGRIPYGVTL